MLGVGLKAPGAGGGDRGAARRCLQVAAVPRCAVLRPRRACALRSAPGAAPAMVSEAAAPLTVRFHGAGEVPTYRNRAVHVWPGSPVAVRRRSGAPWAAPARQNRARGAVRGACGSAVPAPHGPLCPCRPTRLCGRCFSASTLCRGSAWRRTGCSRSEYRHGTPRGWIPPSLLYASVRNEPRGTGRGGGATGKQKIAPGGSTGNGTAWHRALSSGSSDGFLVPFFCLYSPEVTAHI